MQRGKRNAAQLRKGWPVYAPHTSALISLVCGLARAAYPHVPARGSASAGASSRARDSGGQAVDRGALARFDAANWLSPITFIHLKAPDSGCSPATRARSPASFPPFFIPFRVYLSRLRPRSRLRQPAREHATFTIVAIQFHSTRRLASNSNRAARASIFRPRVARVRRRFLKIKSREKPPNG